MGVNVSKETIGYPTDASQCEPIIKTQINTIAQATTTFPQMNSCSDFTLAAMECYEAYGLMREKCRPYVEDAMECALKRKTILRAAIMRSERRLQYEEGSREKEFEEPPIFHYY